MQFTQGLKKIFQQIFIRAKELEKVIQVNSKRERMKRGLEQKEIDQREPKILSIHW